MTEPIPTLFIDGLIAALPITLGYFPIAFAFGVVATGQGLSGIGGLWSWCLADVGQGTRRRLVYGVMAHRETRMLEITPAKVVHIIFQAREEGRADAELQAFIGGLNDDEKAHLTALAWVGRGAFEPEDFAEAVRTAMAEASTPTETYLMGMPHLAENLEAGLEALGTDVSAEEEDFL